MCDTHSAPATEKELHVMGLRTEPEPPDSEACCPHPRLTPGHSCLWDLKKLHDHNYFNISSEFFFFFLIRDDVQGFILACSLSDYIEDRWTGLENIKQETFSHSTALFLIISRKHSGLGLHILFQ